CYPLLLTEYVMLPVMLDAEPCRLLEWDSALFGFPIGQVNGHRLTESSVEEILAWCRNHSAACLYFLADSDDQETTRLEEDNRCRLTDIRVTLERALSGGHCSAVSDQPPLATQHSRPTTQLRLARPEDIPSLKGIARTVHRDSRFHFDT